VASRVSWEAVARTLQLDDAEPAHLLHLAQTDNGSDTLTRPRAARQLAAHPSLHWTLDAVTAGPAFVCNGRLNPARHEPPCTATCDRPCSVLNCRYSCALNDVRRSSASTATSRRSILPVVVHHDRGQIDPDHCTA